MVKIIRKMIQEANLRQVMRSKIGKRVNLRKFVHQSFAKHDTNTAFLYQRPEQINSTNNDLILKINTNMLKFPQYRKNTIITVDNIQNVTQDDSSSINENIFNENEQENHSDDHENSNNISDDDQKTYFRESDGCYDSDDQESYFYESDNDDQETYFQG
ncbi:9762_t:CDS:1, partial [Funneliformis caledonium]